MFGRAPPTGEAEGLLTSLGNVTHFSGGEEALGWLSRCYTDEPTCAHTRSHLLCMHAQFCFLFSIKMSTENELVVPKLLEWSYLGLRLYAGVN